MTEPEFKIQIGRLNEAFKNFYSNSRAKIIANVVEELPVDYFAKCVDRILWQKDPPRIEWFHEITSAFRKKQKVKYQIDQMERTNDSMLDEPTLGMMKKYALRRMDGALSDKDYDDFQQSLRQIIGCRKDIGCKNCLDQGWFLPSMKSHLVECASCDASKSIGVAT